MYKLKVALLLCVIFCTTNSQSAPSFNCQKAKSFSEKTICNDPELSEADVELVNLLKTLKLKTKEDKLLDADAVREWKIRESSCHEISCVKEWYSTRIAYYKNRLRNLQIEEKNQNQKATQNNNAFTPDSLKMGKTIAGTKDISISHAITCLRVSTIYSLSNPQGDRRRITDIMIYKYDELVESIKRSGLANQAEIEYFQNLTMEIVNDQSQKSRETFKFLLGQCLSTAERNGWLN